MNLDKFVSKTNLTDYNAKLNEVITKKIAKYETLPDASEYQNKIVQYIGDTNETTGLVNGYFYQSVYDNVWHWQEKAVQRGSELADVKWGNIIGTITDQTDLIELLDEKDLFVIHFNTATQEITESATEINTALNQNKRVVILLTQKNEIFVLAENNANSTIFAYTKQSDDGIKNIFISFTRSTGVFTYNATKEIELEKVFRFETLPTASADNLGKVYQYIGENSGIYKTGRFYQVIDNVGSYIYKEILMDTDYRVQVDNETIEYNNSEQIEIKDNAISFVKLSDDIKDNRELGNSNSKFPTSQVVSAEFEKQVAKVENSIDSATFILTTKLYDTNNNLISESSVDLPLEELVVSGEYDSAKKVIVLTLKNGNTIQIPVSSLLKGLVNATRKVGSHTLESDISVSDLDDDLRDYETELKNKTIDGDYNNIYDLSIESINSNYLVRDVLDTERASRDRLTTEKAVISYVDEIKLKTEVADIVATHQDLLDYDKSKVEENAIIKVLSDETKEGQTAYWRLVSNSWEFIGIDQSTSVDNTTINFNSIHQLQVKDGAITNDKINAELKSTAIPYDNETAYNTKFATEKAVSDLQVNLTHTLSLDTTNKKVVWNNLNNAEIGNFTDSEIWNILKDTEITITNKTINADNNTISEIETDNFKSGVVQVKGNTLADDDTHLATSGLIKEQVADKIPYATDSTNKDFKIGVDSTGIYLDY